MEERVEEENTAQDTPKSCSAISSAISPKKEGIVQTHEIDEEFLSPTPVKTREPPRIKSKEEIAELPAKYATLLEFFERMTTSLRLLSLRKKEPTFEKISSQVEILTGREFLSLHLGQIKYILPEAVQIDKILIHDEKTNCMKSDMTIELIFDVVKDRHEESAFVALCNVFSSRLREFCSTHPEGFDVPETALPVSQRSITVKEDSVSEVLSTFCETEILNSSHLHPSFKKHFHQKALAVDMEKTDILSPVKSASDFNGETEKLRSLPGSSSTDNMGESTPVKVLAGSDSIDVETPVQSTPMRSISPSKLVLTCEDENKISVSQNSKQSTSIAKKSLDFYSMDGEETIFTCKQLSFSLSDLVLLIHQVFRSVNFCSITKEELVHKIIMNNFEIDDHSEVEMQIRNVEKLVPDWICKKLEPSGVLLYKVKKVSDINSVCERVNII